MSRARQRVAAPPAGWRRLAALFLPARHRDELLADLDERFADVARRLGRGPALRWYRRQAIGFALRLPAARFVDAFRGSDHADRTGHRALSRTTRAPSDVADGAPADRRPASDHRDDDELAGHVRRGATIGSSLEGMRRDLLYAARALRARPGFTIPAVLVLALAIGANAAVLSVVDNVLLRELPVRDAEEVVVVWDLDPPGSRSDRRAPISYRHYRAWSERDDLFSQVAAMETAHFGTIATDEYTISAGGMMVSGNMFELLGAAPALGRALTPSDDAAGADRVIVLGHRLWHTHFGADPDMVGRVITVNHQPTTVVGVMPADFWYYDPYAFHRSLGDRETAQPAFWVPLATDRNWAEEEPDYRAFRLLARLRDGVSLDEATAAAGSMRAALALEDGDEDVSVALTPIDDEVLGDKRARLLLLQGAVTLLLLVACVNLTSLVLAKAAATRGELAVRAALGAGRAALTRLAVGEALLLGGAGGALGLLLAGSLGGVILSVAPRDLPLAHRVGVDWRIAVLTLAIALLAGLLAGVAPALRLDLNGLTRALGAGSRSVVGGRSASRTRFALVAVEVALTLVLLIGATVMVRSFVGTWRADPGFDRDGTLTYFVALSQPPGQEPDYDFHYELLERVRDLPGVVGVGASTHLPFTNWRNTWPVIIDDEATMDDAPRIDGRWVTEGYLDAMGIALRAGRDFTPTDDTSSEPVVLVNEAFVERFFGNTIAGPGDVAGRIIRVGQWGPPRLVEHRIVGVVENVRTSRLYGTVQPLVYQAHRQHPTVFLRQVVRTNGDARALIEPVRRAGAEIDPHQPITEIVPLRDLLAASLTEERFYAWLLGAFGALAFVLAAVGIYGSVAYSTGLRGREIGIRLAFGARPATIRRRVVGQGLAPVALGVVAGCAGAVGLVRGLESLLHGVSPLDVPSFVGSALLFLAVAATAAFIPARRASATDPSEVLRSE